MTDIKVKAAADHFSSHKKYSINGTSPLLDINKQGSNPF